jgi:hypothetical protein
MVSGLHRHGSFAHALPPVYTRRYTPVPFAGLNAFTPVEASHNAKVFESIKRQQDQLQDQFMFQARIQANNFHTQPHRVAQFAGANASVIKAVQDARQERKVDSFTSSAKTNSSSSSKAAKAVASGVGWGIGAALATGILMTLPVMMVGMLGFLPFMHWLWPVAGMMMHAPLAVGGLVGALRGFHVLNKK